MWWRGGLNALLLQMGDDAEGEDGDQGKQLGKIFALEAEAMREEIEALDRAAKRTGTIVTGPARGRPTGRMGVPSSPHLRHGRRAVL